MMYMAIIDYGHGEIAFRHYHGDWGQVCQLAQAWADEHTLDMVDVYELIPWQENSVERNHRGRFRGKNYIFDDEEY